MCLDLCVCKELDKERSFDSSWICGRCSEISTLEFSECSTCGYPRDDCDICFSGGAAGSDVFFGNLAAKMGHDVKHFTFAGPGGYNGPHKVVLSEEKLKAADTEVRKAASLLRKNFPVNATTLNLLRRDWYQIRDTERVYGIVERKNENSTIADFLIGGTGWTVSMAILRNPQVAEIYLFDQAVGKNWWKFEDNNFVEVDRGRIPQPYGRYSGIGTRNLNDEGKTAIEELYE